MPNSNIELLGNFITEYSVKNKDGADIPVYSVSNDKGFCRDYFSKDVSSKDKTSYKIVPRGCFAYNPSRINVGSIAWQDKEDAVIVSPLYVVFSTKGLNNDFLMYYLKSNALMSYIKIYSAGSVRNNLRFKTLSSFPVKVPSLEQQARIVAELDCLAGIIEKKKQQLEELDKLAQSIFYDMFGKEDEVLSRWATAQLQDICSNIVDCPHTTPKKETGPTPYPCIRTSELKGGNISWASMQYVSKQEYETRITRLSPKAGDIVYGREGSFGDAVILPKGYSFCLGQRTMLFRANQDYVNNVFLHRVLISPIIYKQAKDNSVSSTVSHINVKDIKRFLVPIPPLDIQNEFAQKIEAIEKQKVLVKRSIVETETLFNSRMDYWFN